MTGPLALRLVCFVTIVVHARGRGAERYNHIVACAALVFVLAHCQGLRWNRKETARKP